MDIQQFYYFTRIVDYNYNLTTTSEKLHISQPALSKFIIKLEEEYNVKLFVRKNNRYIGLTQAGLLLYETAKNILFEHNLLTQDIYELSKYPSGTITIGVPPLILATVLSKEIIKLINLNPNIKFNIIEKADKELQKLLEKNELDIAILVSPNSINPKIFKETIIYTDYLSIFTNNNNHLLNNIDCVTMCELENIDFIIAHSDFNVTEYILKSFEECESTPKIIYETYTSSFAIEALKFSNAYTILPDPIKNIVDMTNIKTIKIKNPIKWQISITYRIKEKYLPIEKYVIKSIINSLRNNVEIQQMKHI